MKKLLAIGLIAVALTAACGSSGSSSQPSTTTTTTLGPPNDDMTFAVCLKVFEAKTLTDQEMATTIVSMAKSNVPELVDAGNKITQAPTLSAQIAILQGTPRDWCAQHNLPAAGALGG